MRRGRLSRLAVALCLAGGVHAVAGAADALPWTGDITLPALLAHSAPVDLSASDATRLLDSAGLLPAACWLVPARDPAWRGLLGRVAESERRLSIARQFFTARAAEDEENLGTERVAASYGRLTHAVSAAPDATAALELDYRAALSQRNAARLSHRLARAELGFLAGMPGPVGQALDVQALAWPAAPAPDDEGAVRQAQARHPRLLALALNQAQATNLAARGTAAQRAQARACLPALASLDKSVRHGIGLSVQRHHGELQLALDAQRNAARQQVEIAEAGLDRVRSRPVSETGGLSLHEAQIATADAVATLDRVRDSAVLAALTLQALRGEQPEP